jgi:hypothetical protein
MPRYLQFPSHPFESIARSCFYVGVITATWVKTLEQKTELRILKPSSNPLLDKVLANHHFSNSRLSGRSAVVSVTDYYPDRLLEERMVPEVVIEISSWLWALGAIDTGCR